MCLPIARETLIRYSDLFLSHFSPCLPSGVKTSAMAHLLWRPCSPITTSLRSSTTCGSGGWLRAAPSWTKFSVWSSFTIVLKLWRHNRIKSTFQNQSSSGIVMTSFTACASCSNVLITRLTSSSTRPTCRDAEGRSLQIRVRAAVLENSTTLRLILPTKRAKVMMAKLQLILIICDVLLRNYNVSIIAPCQSNKSIIKP